MQDAETTNGLVLLSAEWRKRVPCHVETVREFGRWTHSLRNLGNLKQIFHMYVQPCPNGIPPEVQGEGSVTIHRVHKICKKLFVKELACLGNNSLCLALPFALVSMISAM